MAVAGLAQNVCGESDSYHSNAAAVSSSLRKSQELGLQLRFAAEKGKMVEVRKYLASGAPVLRDAVSGLEYQPFYNHYCLAECSSH